MVYCVYAMEDSGAQNVCSDILSMHDCIDLKLYNKVLNNQEISRGTLLGAQQ